MQRVAKPGTVPHDVDGVARAGRAQPVAHRVGEFPLLG